MRILAATLVTAAAMGAIASIPAAGLAPVAQPAWPRVFATATATGTATAVATAEKPPSTGTGTVVATTAETAEKLPAAEPTRPPATVLSLIAARMRGHDPALLERVAQVVLAESALAGLDPVLVLALIHVESTFDPDAKSDHGAVGLMQLKEQTMRAVLAGAGLPEADPCDPVANVQAGIRYLGEMRDSFQALDTALMAYNAGPTRIRSLLRDGQIPEHLHAYPLRVKQEMAKLAP